MQTFLPLPDFVESARVLDFRRLGKQRVEGMQLVNAIAGTHNGWKNHPACRMWKPYVTALQYYTNCMIDEWIRRGYRNTMCKYSLSKIVYMPHWLGNDAFHKSHRSNLLRKNREFYARYGWTEPDDLPYLWPMGVIQR